MLLLHENLFLDNQLSVKNIFNFICEGALQWLGNVYKWAGK